jgi:formate--tetrahydrofolate ligase
MGLADWVVTEAGFGADLGAEKFFDIKCRRAGISPSAVVLVATPRAISYHGGFENLRAHIENLRLFGVPVVIALNRVQEAAAGEVEKIREFADSMNARFAVCDGWGLGGAGAKDLALAVMEACRMHSEMKLLYSDDLGLLEKARLVAQKIYRARDIAPAPEVIEKLARFSAAGFGRLPVCIAKTPASLSHDPKILGAPDGYDFPLRDAFLYAGAGMVVITAGSIMRMPGLPENPAAENIGLDKDGEIKGLF